MKTEYLTPETNTVDVHLRGSVLALSDPPGGAQTTGFTTQGTYADGDWDID